MTTVPDFNTQTIAEFRANDGKVGGPFAGAPLLLLHTVGALTGETHISPAMYLPDNDRYVVFASKGGAPTNPAWYHNLKAHPDLTIEVGSNTVEVTATEVEGAEHDELFGRQAAAYPRFAEYQAKTTRVIPVIVLTPRQHAT
ncbi:MAG TPA: nitroreductase family deazaflavin-dependent oxidoreductase [Candidatus Saccharimonadales bacterium]|nr:nitroreductase family deazaflavin-dependent oxidoreductase [Candidatus Saccharimonadales bacterium]